MNAKWSVVCAALAAVGTAAGARVRLDEIGRAHV